MKATNACTSIERHLRNAEPVRFRLRRWSPIAVRRGLLAAALLLLPTAQAVAQVDSASGSIDSIMGDLTYQGGVPQRILYQITRTDSTVSLTLLIAGEQFPARGVTLTADRAVFDWTPGDRSVHCDLVRAQDKLDGQCTDGKGESLRLTMERARAP